MRAVKVAALLLLCACSHQQAFIVTAESLNAAGEQFMIVHDYMENASQSGDIAPSQYKAWKNFGLKFQVAFPIAVDLFRIAMLADDLVLKEKAVDVIMSMIPELLKFAQDSGVLIMEFK